MARKNRPKSARRRRSRSKAEPTYLLSYGFAPSDADACECPICKVLDIDLNAVDGFDIRPVTQEQLAEIERYMVPPD